MRLLYWLRRGDREPDSKHVGARGSCVKKALARTAKQAELFRNGRFDRALCFEELPDPECIAAFGGERRLESTCAVAARHSAGRDHALVGALVHDTDRRALERKAGERDAAVAVGRAHRVDHRWWK